MSHGSTPLLRVWNRSHEDREPLVMGVGDRALRKIARIQGRAMGGGLSFVLDIETREAVADACAGYRYFGLESLASLVEQAADTPADSPLLDDFDTEYLELDADALMLDALATRLQVSPDDFAPIA